MVKSISSKKTLVIPKEISITVKSRRVTVKGPRGSLDRDFRHIDMDLSLVTNKDGTKTLIAEKFFSTSKQAAGVQSVISHVKNLITGVTKGFQYKMKFVYAHFPINYNVTDGPTGKNTVLEIRNFIGEKLTRRITMQKGCIVERTANKDEIAITGNDLDMVSISAAQIQQSSIAKNRDLRKFLDGIYVSERLVLGDSIIFVKNKSFLQAC